MSKIEQSVDVEVPVREAYNQWTQFEQFPQFMEGVESVRQTDDTHLHWIATVAGKRQEWDAEITEQRPDQRVAWTSISGDRNAGAVDFHRLSDSRTRVTLTMDVEPSGVVEKVGDALGFAAGQVKRDLEKFKEFIESRGSATGAWRGEVEQGEVTGSRSGSSSGLGSGSDLGGSSSGFGTRERELAGAGSMGTTGVGSDLGSDYGTPGTSRGTGTTGGYGTGTDLGSTASGGGTADDPYGTGTGTSGTGYGGSSASSGTPGFGTGSGTTGSTGGAYGSRGSDDPDAERPEDRDV